MLLQKMKDLEWNKRLSHIIFLRLHYPCPPDSSDMDNVVLKNHLCDDPFNTVSKPYTYILFAFHPRKSQFRPLPHKIAVLQNFYCLQKGKIQYSHLF